MSIRVNKRSISWKNGRIFSLQLRNGHFALLQMLERNGYVAVFNVFSGNGQWGALKLNKSNVLFQTLMLRDILKRSVVHIQDNLPPCEGLEAGRELVICSGLESRKITLWEGTPEEQSFIFPGDGRNSILEMVEENGRWVEKYTPISINDYEQYKNLEMSNLSGYPTFNERLYLCELFGKQVDPLRELAFNRPIGKEFKVYIDIISGKVPISNFGY